MRCGVQALLTPVRRPPDLALHFYMPHTINFLTNSLIVITFCERSRYAVHNIQSIGFIRFLENIHCVL